MSKIEKTLYYTNTHEWLKVTDGTGVVGITDFAQDQLGDIVYIELPEIGKSFKKGEVFGSVESVKSVSDLYAPVDCEVIELNEALSSQPEMVNKAPYSDGWMIKIKLIAPEQVESLLSAQEYESIIS